MLKTLNEIEAKPQIRVSSGFPMFDKALGENDGIYGFVEGGMYYFYGAPGVGKSRLSIQMMENFANQGKTSLVCQGEADLNAFAGWAKNKPDHISKLMYLTDDMDFATLMELIADLRPSFVVIDSANMVNGIEGVKDIQEKYKTWKKTVSSANTVCFLLGQLNKDGSLKGNTTVPHLVDVVGTMFKPKIKRGTWNVPTEIDGQRFPFTLTWGTDTALNTIFRVEVGKNRFGPSNHFCDFQHRDTGITYLSSDLETDHTILRWNMPEHEWIVAEYYRKYANQQATSTKKKGFFGSVLDWLNS